jgi:hypothetical protein
MSKPTPAPVTGATLAVMRSTSAKASVTSAKYDPLSPARKLSAPMIAPTKAPAAIAKPKAIQALTPKRICRIAVA